jgi:hypothetical protein
MYPLKPLTYLPFVDSDGHISSIIGRKIKTSTSCDTVVSLDMLSSEVQLINFDGIAIDACIVGSLDIPE